MGLFFYYMSVKQALVIAALLVGLSGCYSGPKPASIGKKAPDFTVKDSDHTVSLSDYKGKVVLLNFWATWCSPCVQEMPSLVELQRRMKDKGVVVLGVSIDVDEGGYHKFIRDHGVNFVTVRDGKQTSPNLYGTFGWPETYVIDRTGTIRRKFIGAVDWSSPDIDQYLSNL
jgi:cytochrome c biogenesis protein CcmG, thiol:disulfide interchange protein DsbE